MKKILIATHNKGKLEEYRSFLTPIGFEVVSLEDEKIKAEAPEEGGYYLEIARSKALFYSKFSKLPIITDDSGLEIKALGGFPGISSDRWMEGSAEDKNKMILHKMRATNDRRAKFKAVTVFFHKNNYTYFEGEVNGEISLKPSGVGGFGYDSIFYISEKKRTMAELTLSEKNKISHRAKALQKLVSYLKKRYIEAA
ncbi:MAG: RdgB/HAM1 family non-canonical purine NTP pyrophosphatase [Candidatus Woykebacteria bacterium]